MAFKKKAKKETKKKDPNTLNTQRVISNNLFALKIIHSVAPSYLPTYFLWSVGNAILNFLINIWLLREIVNRYEEGRPASEVIGMLIGLVAAQMVWYCLIQTLPDIVYPRYRQRIVEHIQRGLFEKASEVELACYENPEFYDKYVKAMDNAYSRCMDVVYTVDSCIWAVVSILSTGAMLFFIDPVLIAFSLLPLLIGLIRNLRNKVSKKRKDERKKLDRREAYVQRTFYLNEFAKEMRLTGFPGLMLSIYGKAQANHIALWRKYGLRLTLLRLLSDSSHYLTSAAAMLYAAFSTLVSHSMQIGDCLVVFNSVDAVAGSLTRMAEVFTAFRDHAMYIEDYRYFLEYEPKIANTPGGRKAAAGTLRAEHLSFTYTGAEKPALKDVNLTIRPGEKIALVGHNGSGKTTLVKMLLHLYEPDTGTVTLDGVPAGDYDAPSWRDAFTTVFQDFKMFSFSVAENVLLRPLKDGDDALVTDALQRSGAWERVEKMENGIHTTLTREFDDEGEVLSVGEAQKVSLARAFTNDSPFVILDEPSSALDPVAEYKMFGNMLEACENRTLIFISHRLSSAVLADRIFYMEDGAITEEGTHAELMAKNGKYAALFRMQAENYRETEDEIAPRDAGKGEDR